MQIIDKPNKAGSEDNHITAHPFLPPQFQNDVSF